MLIIKCRFVLCAAVAWLLGHCAVAFGQPTPEKVLVEFDSSWRYFAGEAAPAGRWASLEFDDSSWASGEGIIGYDSGDRSSRWQQPGLMTQVRSGLMTYYVRTDFSYDGPRDGAVVQLDLIVDDAAVVYLNGQEIGRSALMPAGDVAFGTASTSAVTVPTISHSAIEVDGSLLRPGRNVLAASVHNHQRTSSDIAWAAQLRVVEATVQPLAMYLTWQRDPTSTMTVLWHEQPGDAPFELEYVHGDEVRRVDAHTRAMPHSDRTVHMAELTGLRADTAYRFRLRREMYGQSTRWYLLRTMPQQADRPIRIVVGGDVLHQVNWMEQTNQQALRFDPDFILWGGDLAYADGRPERVQRWYDFFKVCNETLIRGDGRVVPMVVTIGNHEVQGHYFWGDERGRGAYENTDAFRESISPYFYSLYPFPGHPGYGSLDFGEYLSLILLDTDHTGPVEGPQTQWLAKQLAQRGHMKHIVPVYHYPAFPSVRDYHGNTPTRIRTHWVPLFEQAGVRVAFEHHDHAYKRTVPIAHEQEDADGIVYIGDGAWGVNTRQTHEVDATWYLEQAMSIRHFILWTLQDDVMDFKAISIDGELIDHSIVRPAEP